MRHLERHAASCLALALALAPACSSEERDESARVASGIERLRATTSADLPARKRATEDLAALRVTTPRAKAARDACVKAYRTSSEMFELLGKLSAKVRSDKPVDNPTLLAEEFRRVDALRDQAAEELDTCNARSAELASPD